MEDMKVKRERERMGIIINSLSVMLRCMSAAVAEKFCVVISGRRGR
jgi:hypothetical protein